MLLKYCFLFLLTSWASLLTFAQKSKNTSVEPKTISLNDNSRNRLIPIAVYSPIVEKKKKLIPIFLSPGYPGKSTQYRYIAQNLAEKGYLVVVIQHDLTTDPPIPTGENLYQKRLPLWENGMKNILFVLQEMKILYPNVNYKQLILIGHSNGGDISMLTASKHPKKVNKVISLDNLRVPFPLHRKIKIYSIRSKDKVADRGVIPNRSEIEKYKITIIDTEIVHDDMGGMAPKNQLNQINLLITDFLRKR